MLVSVLVLSTLVAFSHQQKSCSSTDTFLAVNGVCPTGFTVIESKCCPSASVVDCADLVNPSTGVSDCSRNVGLCNNSAYLSFMKVQCRKTCGFCTSTPAPTCVDKINTSTGRSDCAQNVNLCNNAVYRSLMQQQCPKTCGFC